jgi:hypothetical protein
MLSRGARRSSIPASVFRVMSFMRARVTSAWKYRSSSRNISAVWARVREIPGFISLRRGMREDRTRFLR